MHQRKLDKRPALIPKWDLALLAIFLFLALSPFVIPAIPPMTDLPNHLYNSFAIAHYSDPNFTFSRDLELRIGVFPTVLPQLLLSGIMMAFGPIVSGKIYLIMNAFLLSLGTFLFARSLGSSRPVLVAASAVPIIHFMPFASGTLPYCTSIAIFALFLSIWFGVKDTKWRFVALSVIVLVAHLCHIVASAAIAFAICAFTALDYLQNSDFNIRRAISDLACVFMAGIFILAFSLGGDSPDLTPVLESPLQMFKNLFKFSAGTLSLAGTVVLTGGIVLLYAYIVFRQAKNTLHRAERNVAILSATFLTLAFLMPNQLGAWWIVGPRLVPFSIILLLPLLNFKERLGRTISLAILSAMMAVLVTANYIAAAKVNEVYSRFLAGVSHIERNSELLPIIAPAWEEVGYITPYYSIGSYYNIERGGVNPYLYAKPYVKTNASAVTIRKPEDRYALLFDKDKFLHPEDYRGVGTVYDYVIAFQVDPRLSSLLGSEMEMVFHSQDLEIYKRSPGR